ncbi:N-lysine methyltransferase KMT5A-A-like [Pecten maximus]|uniref:N-lysine methyltransferase KMT5A-A-like n=1 Tax=Pecten maximus TaxID=6579 RepID=UPI001458749D|nr:N-lysine methyltransferase KMT5A-A-like [Pecten maximus]
MVVNMNLRKRKQSWKENEEEIDKNGLHLYIKTSTGKGRGVYAGKAIEAGEDICRYQGMVQETDPADEDDTYVFEINFKGKKLWVNATKEDDTFGRLINDNHKNPNCRAKVFESDGQPQIVFKATRYIQKDEEICYNYGPGPYPWRTKVVSLYIFSTERRCCMAAHNRFLKMKDGSMEDINL